jgi:hypothetical protein
MAGIVYVFPASAGSFGIGVSGIATGLTTSPEVKAITMTGPDSAVVWGAADWSAAAAESPSPAATTHSTSSPGPSASPVAQVQTGRYTFYFSELDDQPSTGSQSYGYSGASAGPIAVVVQEITGGPPAALFRREGPRFVRN